jgi:hypothetical protein
MASIQAHDELAALFARNLTFNPDAQASVPRHEGAQHLDAFASPSSAQNVVYSVSQHYNHSAHIVNPSSEGELGRPSSEPTQSDTMNCDKILRIHGVDPMTLTPSQIQLFKVADAPQQRRLIELWNICPPNNAADIPSLAWSSTTVAQEEHLARARYESLQMGQAVSLDGTVVQTSNGQWHQEQESEPYMSTGYEELMRREREREAREKMRAYSQATDPVFMGPDYARQQQQMEMASQYGAFEHYRGAGQADAMDVMM